MKSKVSQDPQFNQLCKGLSSLKGESEFSDFLQDIMTPQEIKAISARFEIARRLYQTDQPYRQIAKETAVSTTTVTRVNDWLERGQGGYNKALSRLFGENKHHHSDKKAV